MARVLVAEDIPSVLYLLREFFKLKGYKVDTAESAFEAAKKLGKNDYHLIVLSIKMESKHLLEILRSLIERAYKFPVIICTAYEDLKEDVDIIAKGKLDVDFVTKPPDLEHLWIKVVRLLEKNAIREEPSTDT
ncbi:response regulator [candidate division WOR-3 bacterium]|nr:response regulator [candidate division WOR-3 bacterium]